jgi:hypothetical protein
MSMNIKTKRKNHPSNLFRSWRFLGFLILFLISLILAGVNSRNLTNKSFCNTNGDLFKAIADNTENWKAAFPQTFDSSGVNQLFFTIKTGQKYAVNAVYWTESRAPILFVPVETKLESLLRIRKYGLFYTPYAELPIEGVFDEIIQLDDRIFGMVQVRLTNKHP